MKSHITVILNKDSLDIRADLEKALEPHRLNDDDLNSIRNHHWDYWYFPEEQPINDDALLDQFPELSLELLDNTSFIKHLPKTYSTSGIIDVDGLWTDLLDFGWKLLNEPSKDNTLAIQSWEKSQRNILNNHLEDIAVQVMVHH